VAALENRYGTQASNIVAAIGPHIGVCCYEVGEEVAESFADSAVVKRSVEWPRPHLNLGEANRRQLLKAGLREQHIEISSLCTRCREDLFFSYRREGTKTGHLLSVIGIAP
jgi:hypothetical protein